MKPRWPGTAYILLVGLSIGAFMTGGHFAATALIDAQRSKELRELSEVALRRSEVAVDEGVVTLDELIKRGPIVCDAAALQAVRLRVYQRSGIKDIRAVNPDGSVVCSAYAETLEFDKGWVDRADMLPARNDAVRLFRVDQFYGIALGVLKDVDAKSSLVAILGINGDLFDIMPAELRDHSEVVVELSNGAKVAQYSSDELQSSPSSSKTFGKASERYPLRATIRVDAAALDRWNREPYLPITGLALVLGSAFGLLLAGAVARPKSPVAELDRALAAREFRPFLQPLFDLRSGAITGCEVLARWVRADGSVIPPLRFIQLAESSGRIEPMTWQIVSAALEELRPILTKDKSFKVSINIVPHHMVSPGFVGELRRIVGAALVSPRQVVLELTEREELEDLEAAASVIAELGEHGFQVAIDDVGTGHSGLSQIQRLGANILKIDKFFIDSITRDSTAKAVVEMLVRLARELKMSVLAEGIETREQISALIACGVEDGQGYVVSPPLSVPHFIAFLERQRAGAASSEYVEEPPVRAA
jgi:sensor c-di-GMP phosphodiesterase-like protein